MTAQPAQPAQPAPPSLTARLLPLSVWAAPVLAFAAFGALVGARASSNLAVVAGVVVVGVLFAFLGTHLLVLVLAAAHRQLDSAALHQAAAIGLLLLAPFAALALVAELLLGWNASQVFSSAGLMTACGAVGVELGRRGGMSLRGALLPTIIAFLLSMAWISLSVLAGRIWS